VDCVRDHPRDRRDPDRCQRRRRSCTSLPCTEEEEQRHDHDPSADSEQGAEESSHEADEDEPHGPYSCNVDLLARLSEVPAQAALFLDVDGVLAPIVPRPEDARVPEETRAELRRLGGRYALVACISGRSGADAQRIVGVPELVYVGNHGLELQPEAEEWAARLRRFLTEVEWQRVEDKRLTATLHYRGVDDEDTAREELEMIAEHARGAGFVARFGRKVLELVPPIAANKGTAIQRLLEECAIRRALFAGDDTTDLDGFRALDGLELAVRIAVVSEEGPAELRDAADLAVSGPGELLTVLRRL
jgi:trehalose 6-phosphate phosphatase